MSLIQSTAEPVIPRNMECHKEGLSIIRTKNLGYCAVLYEPFIKNGNYRFEGFFKNSDLGFSIGIADESVVFEADDEVINIGKFKGKIVDYYNEGGLYHMSFPGLKGNGSFREGQKVAMEVNMDTNPRKLRFFIEGVEQPLSVINIPECIRFWIGLQDGFEISFTLTQFQSLSSPSPKMTTESKEISWGKDWNKKCVIQ
ncbi:MAG: hypothetical protein EZS28_007865 [Streblomastix strix]|uniref:B30.2/SPRY domain-containing protein n=1 Tax=Streblomastix strix TaxID=222440 RepID=A0A5J4WND8_9EUKA|nr:MAG: hypothetical protein EZS28_007865 [Streblomastix strix]